MKRKESIAPISECAYNHLAIRDAIDLLAGKWKIQVLCVLMQHEGLCFLDIVRHVHGISAKTLTKELRELELNELVTRTVMATRPVTVQYALTAYGHTLEPVVFMLLNWGLEHRKRLTGKNSLGERNIFSYIEEMQQEWPVNKAKGEGEER